MIESKTVGTAPRRAGIRTFFIRSLGLYVAAALVFLIAGGGAPEDRLDDRRTEPDAPPSELGPIHEVQFETLLGDQATLASYAGQPLIINFFASTCAPCVQEMPDLQRFHQSHGAEVSLIGLAVEGARPALGIVAETGVTYDTGLAPGDLLVDLGGYGMPTTVFISESGEILQSHTGLLTYDQLVAKADELFVP